jgi:hypothetical protein
MKYNGEEFELSKIDTIIGNRLIRVPTEVKKTFPSILKGEGIWRLTVNESYYLMVSFPSFDDDDRIQDFLKRGLNPFPGLVTTKEEKAAFRIDKSKNIYLKSCSVVNSYSFSLGKDSTIILEDHTQIADIVSYGKIEYKLPLSYIVSYGEEINRVTVYEYFEGLVVHSAKLWREAHDK